MSNIKKFNTPDGEQVGLNLTQIGSFIEDGGTEKELKQYIDDKAGSGGGGGSVQYTTTDLSSISNPSNMQVVTLVNESNQPMCTFEYDGENSVWLPQMLYYDYLPDNGGILSTICNTMMAHKANIRLHTKLNIKFNTSESETVNLEMFVKDFWAGTNVTFTAFFNVYTESGNEMKFIDANFYFDDGQNEWYKRPENPMIQ